MGVVAGDNVHIIYSADGIPMVLSAAGGEPPEPGRAVLWIRGELDTFEQDDDSVIEDVYSKGIAI